MNEKKIININNNNDDNNKPSKKQKKTKTKQYDTTKNEFLLTELKKKIFKCDRIKYIENNYFNSLFLFREKLIKLKNHQEIEIEEKIYL